jgi:hypothetical protein
VVGGIRMPQTGGAAGWRLASLPPRGSTTRLPDYRIASILSDAQEPSRYTGSKPVEEPGKYHAAILTGASWLISRGLDNGASLRYDY